MSKTSLERGLTIARGLIVSGKAIAPQTMSSGGFIKLFAGNDVHYWVRRDGQLGIRAERNGDIVEELTSVFLDKMEEAGNSPEGQGVELVPRMPSTSEDPWIYDSYDPPYRPPGWG